MHDATARVVGDTVPAAWLGCRGAPLSQATREPPASCQRDDGASRAGDEVPLVCRGPKGGRTFSAADVLSLAGRAAPDAALPLARRRATSCSVWETAMDIRAMGPEDRDWVEERLRRSWGSTRVALRGAVVDVTAYPGLVAGARQGLLHFRPHGPKQGEILTLEAFEHGRGIGTALVEAYAERAKADGLEAVVVVTTNDNVDALRFYQTRGFVIKAVRLGAVTKARSSLKPEIPLTGAYGIPIRDEIELIRSLA